MKRILLLAMLAALFAVPSVLAASPQSSATVSVAPNPVVVNTDATVTGCGYGSNATLWVGTVVGGNYAVTDSAGCFSFVRQFSLVGQIQVIVYNAPNGKVHSKSLVGVYVTVTAS